MGGGVVKFFSILRYRLDVLFVVFAAMIYFVAIGLLTRLNESHVRRFHKASNGP